MAFTKNTYNVTLDIKRHHGFAPKILSVTGDTANQIVVTLTNNGAPMDIAGLYVRAVFLRSDGRVVTESESDNGSPLYVEKSLGRVTVNVLNGSFRDGDNFMEIQILADDPDDGDILNTTSRLLIRARRCILNDEAVEASAEVTALQAYLVALDNMDATANTLAAGSNATASLTMQGNHYRLVFGIPRGADGADAPKVTSISYNEILGRLVFSFDDGSALSADMHGYTEAIHDWVTDHFYKQGEFNAIPIEALSSTVQSILNNAITQSALEPYATKAWVEAQGYGQGGGGEGVPEVFTARYGTTILADIASALVAGKICKVVYNGNVYYGVSKPANDAPQVYEFFSMDTRAGVIHSVYVDSDGWHTGEDNSIGARLDTLETKDMTKLGIIEQGAINTGNSSATPPVEPDGRNWEDVYPTSNPDGIPDQNKKRVRFSEPISYPFRVITNDGYGISAVVYYNKNTGAYVGQLTTPSADTSRFWSRNHFESKGDYGVRLQFAKYDANGNPVGTAYIITPETRFLKSFVRTDEAIYSKYSALPAAHLHEEVITDLGLLYSDGYVWRSARDRNIAAVASGYKTVTFSDMTRVAGLNDTVVKSCHSLTKLLTAYIAIKYDGDPNKAFSLADTIEIVSYTGMDASTECVQAGDIFTGEDLLNAAIIASDNNAADELGRAIYQSLYTSEGDDQARAKFATALMRAEAMGVGISSDLQSITSAHGQMKATPAEMCTLIKALYFPDTGVNVKVFENIAKKTSYTMTSTATNPRAPYTVYSTTTPAARALIPEYVAGKTGTGGTGASANASYGFVWTDLATGVGYITVLMDSTPSARFRDARQMIDEVASIRNGNAPIADNSMNQKADIDLANVVAGNSTAANKFLKTNASRKISYAAKVLDTEIDLNGGTTGQYVTVGSNGAVAYASAPSGGGSSASATDDITVSSMTGIQTPQSILPGDTLTDAIVLLNELATNPQKELALATYGTTTIAQLDAMISAGKLPYMVRNDVYLYLCKKSTGEYYYFCGYDADDDEYTIALAQLSNQATSWSVETLELRDRQKKIERIFISTSGAVSQVIQPNTVYMFVGDLTSLTLTLGTPIDGIANIYQVFFKNGLTPVTLTLPASVDIGDFVPEAEKISELNIQLVEIGNVRNYCIARGDNR